MNKPIHQVGGPARIYADQLLKLAVNLPLKGIERSVKLAPGQFHHQRFLLGIPPTAWRPALFTAICAELHMPPAVQALFMSAIAKANFLGLAFELGETGCVYKAYLEYPVLIKRHQYEPGRAPDPALQYQGFKWDPAHPEKFAVTDYLWQPNMPKPVIEQQLAAHLQGIRNPSVSALIRFVFESAAARIDARQLIYLEVSEQGSPRRSFDFNMYPANIPLAHIAAQISEIGRQFGIDNVMLSALLQRDAAQTLGHISAGCDRNGQDFLTFYYDH